jgi:type I restriction enzyme R subunit
LWFGQTQRDITDHQIAIIRQVVDYIASNGTCSIPDIKEDDATTAAQLVAAFGGAKQANEALKSLSQFILYRKTA